MLAEMIAARETARPMPDDRMTVGKWLRLWVESPSVTRLRATSQEAYRYAVRLLLPELGGIPLRKLRSTNVEAALANLPGGTNARAVLSTAVKDAMRAGHVTTNEAALARGKRPSRKLVAPDTATVRAILDQLKPHRLYALYVLLAGTGLRIGEATGLRWEDVTLDGEAPTQMAPEAGAGQVQPLSMRRAATGLDSQHPALARSVADRVPSLTVTYQVQRINGELVHTDPKTDTAGRVVHLPPVLQAALRAHKARQAAERLRAGPKWRQTDLVFTTATGGAVSEQTAHWTLTRAAELAGVRHVSCHDLRRAYLSVVQDAVGMEAAQLVAGHTNPKQTAAYVTVRDRLLSAAADAAEEALG